MGQSSSSKIRLSAFTTISMIKMLSWIESWTRGIRTGASRHRAYSWGQREGVKCLGMRSRFGGSSAATCCSLRAEKSLVALHRPELRASSCLRIFLQTEFGDKLIQKTSLSGKQLGFGNPNWE